MQEFLDKLDELTFELEQLAEQEVGKSAEDQMKGAGLEDALLMFFKFKETYNKLDKVRKLIYHRLDYYNKAYIPKLMEQQGVEDGVKVRVSNTEGRNFRVTTKYSAKVGDREGLYEWLRNRGDEDLITETVNAQTLTSYLQNLMKEEGIEAPDNIVEMSSYDIVGITKYTIKE